MHMHVMRNGNDSPNTQNQAHLIQNAHFIFERVPDNHTVNIPIRFSRSSIGLDLFGNSAVCLCVGVAFRFMDSLCIEDAVFAICTHETFTLQRNYTGERAVKKKRRMNIKTKL